LQQPTEDARRIGEIPERVWLEDGSSAIPGSLFLS